jgi:hypothetical protein
MPYMPQNLPFLDALRYTRRQLLALSAGVGMALFTACGLRNSHSSSPSTPTTNHLSPPPYPNFSDRNAVIAQAQHLSDRLEQYVKNWLDGKVPASIPDDLLPDGREPSATHYYLQKPEEVIPEHQWGIREAQPVDFNATLGLYPDPHATYLVMRWFYAPFGSKVILIGQFPHSRFFDIQVTPSFHPESYRYDGYAGVGEVPIVDVDIDPLPGSINPFRSDADRTISNRHYQVTYDLQIGNPVDLNPAFHPPYYRAPGNHRVGGAIMYQGPWGEKRYNPPGNGRGLWDTGSIWIRYYAPDKQSGALGGVPLPKVLYQLPDGRQYFINADFSGWSTLKNQKQPLPHTAPKKPDGRFQKATFGWHKQWGIFRVLLEGVLASNPQYLRDMDRGITGRGEELAPPNNFEPSATTCTYINYIGRGMALEADKVVVLTGKLPTTPRTRNGERTMTAAQARYWSLTSYSNAIDLKHKFSGAVINSIMDDEITTDNEGRYIILYSRLEDRPVNATDSNGVTWVNWGPVGSVAWTLRWLSVHPDWTFSQAPDEKNLGWATDTASIHYDPKIIGENNQNGFLGPYQPIIHYLSKQEFEALGTSIIPDRIPVWK